MLKKINSNLKEQDQTHSYKWSSNRCSLAGHISSHVSNIQRSGMRFKILSRGGLEVEVFVSMFVSRTFLLNSK